MRLATTHTTIKVDGVTARLRPTLRAACTLHARHGFAGMVDAITAGNVTVMADIIAEASEWPNAVPAVMCEIEQRGVVRLDALTAPLLTFVTALAGLDADARDDSKSEGPRVSFEDHFARLYAIGTGWMGWTPAETWAATPAEITAAYQGRLDMLKAIFGSDDKPEPANRKDMSLSQKVAATMSAIGARVVKRRKASA